jgi:hypothetical protein
LILNNSTPLLAVCTINLVVPESGGLSMEIIKLSEVVIVLSVIFNFDPILTPEREAVGIIFEVVKLVIVPEVEIKLVIVPFV